MVLLESCKGCGASEFGVERREGYDFLVCSHCKSTVALLSDKDKKEVSSPTNRDFLGDYPYGSGMMIDFKISSSGEVYSGLPIGWHWSNDIVVGT